MHNNNWTKRSSTNSKQPEPHTNVALIPTQWCGCDDNKPTFLYKGH